MNQAGDIGLGIHIQIKVTPLGAAIANEAPNKISNLTSWALKTPTKDI